MMGLNGWTPGLEHWMLLALLLFSIGVYGLLTRRNVVGVLLSTELMLNSAAMNFVIFNHYMAPGFVDGSIMAIFIIAIAAAEVVVAMAIFVALLRIKKTADVTQMKVLRG
jgi:NADH:ubiquinone oxidoreductase subunit K